ncbi:hypothetical protein HH214_02125 [Mucilaginibacter robiniae]|uniref:Uncharacterized protein n=1 Tax=Mucilaginibacter robiniae TaxID=2728022 RepID=A0A7L5DUG1_9SPHI|nr:hypothetical protein [Mucilaginibacter robiniae]QJD94755.1 hypothetical protein HH214_02125 [Mucilaginibacter robiniae]
MYDTNSSLPDASGKISVSTAATLTANWRSYLATSGQDFQTKAFLIPINSIKNLLANNPDAEGVRVYLGLEDASDADSGKLVIVPTIGDNDIIFMSDSSNNPDSEDDSNVYDRTDSCPPLCPVNNVLNS